MLNVWQLPPIELDQAQLKMPFEVIKKSIEESARQLLDQIKREAVTFKASMVKSTSQEQAAVILSLERQLGEWKKIDFLFFHNFICAEK